MRPYTGPKLAPMSKMSLYGSRQTSQLMPLTKWYCHSLFILPTSFIVHEHGPLVHSLLQQFPIDLDFFQDIFYIASLTAPWPPLTVDINLANSLTSGTALFGAIGKPTIWSALNHLGHPHVSNLF